MCSVILSLELNEKPKSLFIDDTSNNAGLSVHPRSFTTILLTDACIDTTSLAIDSHVINLLGYAHATYS